MIQTDNGFIHVMRRGFTLIELLVSISVIALLMSLLLPAIQNTRETSRKILCANHLKQLGLAIHSYHDTHKFFPVEILYTEPGTQSESGYWSWGVTLLPYLDQNALYMKLNPQGEQLIIGRYYNRHGTIVPGGEEKLAVFTCPSAIIPATTTNLGPGTMKPEYRGYGKTDFKVCMGGNHGNGLFPWGPRYLSFANVTDGLSSTIAIGEASMPDASGKWWAFWMGDSSYGFANDFTTSQPMNCVQSFSGRYWMNSLDDGCALGLHVGVVQFVFADGSVHALSQSMDRQVYDHLGDINDGNPISNW